MSTTAIKWLALVLMLVDHLGEFFPQSVPLWFRWLGRMSAPLFLFCLLAVSYTHLTLPTIA